MSGGRTGGATIEGKRMDRIPRKAVVVALAAVALLATVPRRRGRRRSHSSVSLPVAMRLRCHMRPLAESIDLVRVGATC